MLRSQNAGRLLQYLKKDGEHVSVGEIYAEIESMKMVINLEVKKAGGRLIHVAQPGQVLFPGTLIARLDDQDDMAASKPTVFIGKLEEWDKAEELRQKNNSRLNTQFETIFQACKDLLNGYAVPEKLFKKYITRLIDDLFTVLKDKHLPFELFKARLNVVENR